MLINNSAKGIVTVSSGGHRTPLDVSVVEAIFKRKGKAGLDHLVDWFTPEQRGEGTV